MHDPWRYGIATSLDEATSPFVDDAKGNTDDPELDVDVEEAAIVALRLRRAAAALRLADGRRWSTFALRCWPQKVRRADAAAPRG